MKSKTHIYLANQILKEVKETGAVTLKDYGKFSVPNDVISAISKYPKAFRAGSVGPDFFPDMIVGQTVIHPADSGKWLDRMETELLSMPRNNAEWEKAYAFYLGFLTHYSGDMFGHDYVNEWAKGSFPEMTDAIKDVELAKVIMRHIMVESYMDERVPKSEDLSLDAPIDFIFRCFASEDAAKLYPDSSTNVLKFMIELKGKIHAKSQDTTIRTIDIANYFPSWEKDIDSAIMEWLKMWNRIAGYFVEEHGMSKTKDDIMNWFKEWGPKLTCIPKWIVSFLKLIGDIAEFLNLFKLIEEAFKAMMKDVLKALVFAVTGINEDDIDKLIKQVEDFFKNPKLYLNNGVLYDSKDITDQLDKEFGNYGINQDVQNHTFLAFARSLNMCRMSVMGANNLNALVGKYYNGTPLFKEKPVRCGFNKLDITIRTGKDAFSGTDDNVYFAVILNNDKVLEMLMDKPGYNDFENGDVDTYRFDLPETVYYDSIKSLRIRKDYIECDDDWKMQHVKVVDVDSGFCLVDKETNAWLKKRASYELSANQKTSSDKLSVDAKVMDHLYSLDVACPQGQPDYKPWNEPKFFMNINSELRSKVLLPLFKLDDQPIAPAVFYSVHAANIGWMDDVSSGEMAGTTGEARQLEAIKIWLNSKGSIFYSAHVAGKGWLPYVKNCEVAGTTGESRQMEAIKIRIENMPGYTVTYRVHMADKGWSSWVCNDAVAGTTGESRRIEAIEIKLIK